MKRILAGLALLGAVAACGAAHAAQPATHAAQPVPTRHTAPAGCRAALRLPADLTGPLDSLNGHVDLDTFKATVQGMLDTIGRDTAGMGSPPDSAAVVRLVQQTEMDMDNLHGAVITGNANLTPVADDLSAINRLCGST